MYVSRPLILTVHNLAQFPNPRNLINVSITVIVFINLHFYQNLILIDSKVMTNEFYIPLDKFKNSFLIRNHMLKNKTILISQNNNDTVFKYLSTCVIHCLLGRSGVQVSNSTRQNSPVRVASHNLSSFILGESSRAYCVPVLLYFKHAPGKWYGLFLKTILNINCRSVNNKIPELHQVTV